MDIYYSMEAHRLLAEAREAAGLTQAQVASRAGTTQAVVSRIESGRTEPELATLARLLLACGRALVLSTVDWAPEEDRQLDDSLALTHSQRAARNQRQTAMAAKAAAARRAGRVRPLVPVDG